MIISISTVLTELCSYKLFIDPVSEQGNSDKVGGCAAVVYEGGCSPLVTGLAKLRVYFNIIAAGKTGNSNEDVLILLFVGEWSSAVSLSNMLYWLLFQQMID